MAMYELDRLRLVNGKRMSIEHRIIPDELGRHITPAMLEAKPLAPILDEEFDLQVQRVEGRIRAGLARGQTADRLGVRRGSAGAHPRLCAVQRRPPPACRR